jgi:hypothetical protein
MEEAQKAMTRLRELAPLLRISNLEEVSAQLAGRTIAEGLWRLCGSRTARVMLNRERE